MSNTIKGAMKGMLTMIQVHNIRKLYNFKGKSISDITKYTGHNYRTVVKYLEKSDFNINADVTDRRGRPRKIDAVIPVIDKWLVQDKTAPFKQRHTAKRIYDRLIKEHPDIMAVGYRSIAKYVSEKRKEIYKDNEGFIPLYHPEGEAQVDFGKADFIQNGKTITEHYINMTFPNSNANYAQIFMGENQECFLEGMKRIFEYMKHVPYKIWFDNLSAAVIIGKNKERNLVEQFKRFAMHYGFEINFCNPNSGHEKGAVENKVGYTRRNIFVPVPTFDNIDEYNKELLHTCDLDMNRKHYIKDALIRELFDKEKQYMYKLPDKAFEVCRIKSGITNNYGKVEFETNLYSTSPRFASQEVMIKVTADKVILLDKQSNVIVTHDRIYDKHKESMKWLPYLETLSKRPTAIKYTRFFNELPDIWKNYISSHDKEGKKSCIIALMRIIEDSRENGIQLSVKALKETLSAGVTDVDSLMVTYYRIKNFESFDNAINEININKNMAPMKKYKVDINVYDSLCKKAVTK